MRIKFALVVFLAIAGYFLVTEHGAHLARAIPYLPWLLLLSCPLLHFIVPHGHGHGSHRDHDKSSS